MFRDWTKAFEDALNVSSIVFIGMFIWLCIYGSWLNDVVSYEVYDLVTYGCIFGLCTSVIGRSIAWALGKIISRKEAKAKVTIDPFVIG